MTETTWEVGDRYRSRDRDVYRTFTVVQVLDDERYQYLVGYWRRDRETKKMVARYAFVRAEDLRFAYKQEPREVTAAAPKGTKTEWARLYKRAHEAGVAALKAATPTPMVVGTPRDIMASLTGKDYGGFDPNEPTYYVAGGVCGFAWVVVRPGTSSFARWLVKTGKGSAHYGGGVSIWVREGGQSLERKESYARAFAKVLTEAGVEAFSDSRMD